MKTNMKTIMKTSLGWFALVCAVCVGCGDGGGGMEVPDAGEPADAGDNGTTTYTEEMLGTPVFRIVDWQRCDDLRFPSERTCRHGFWR